MEVHNVSNNKFNELKQLSLGKNICHTESEIYFYDKKDKIFKKFYVDFGEIFSNKLYTISSLIENRSRLYIDEIVFPEQIITISQQISGYIMPLVKGVNFDMYIKQSKRTLEEKQQLFKQLTEILIKMKNIRDKENIAFFINDFHEGNIMYNVETKKLNIIDTDSFSILNNQPFPSRYLSRNSYVSYFPNKYKVNNSEIFDNVIPSQNTDLYCYTIMLLKLLYKDDFISTIGSDLKTLMMYIDYLEYLGLSSKMTDKLRKPFMDEVDNEFIYDEIDEINEDIYSNSSSKQFKEYAFKKY